jgi:hypothetical protein
VDARARLELLPREAPHGKPEHHADDLRSHVLSILGARGIELPDLAMWGYAEAMGQVHELEPKSD